MCACKAICTAGILQTTVQYRCFAATNVDTKKTVKLRLLLPLLALLWPACKVQCVVLSLVLRAPIGTVIHKVNSCYNGYQPPPVDDAEVPPFQPVFLSLLLLLASHFCSSGNCTHQLPLIVALLLLLLLLVPPSLLLLSPLLLQL
jgi:hypothetical protein